jgi:uncharacterized protein DUF6284
MRTVAGFAGPAVTFPPRKEASVVVLDLLSDLDGPTSDELAAIEAEWPLIAAELALVGIEIRVLTVPGGPAPLDWRRLRRAEHRVWRETVAWLAASRPTARRAVPRARQAAA